MCLDSEGQGEKKVREVKERQTQKSRRFPDPTAAAATDRRCGEPARCKWGCQERRESRRFYDLNRMYLPDRRLNERKRIKLKTCTEGARTRT